MNNFFREQKLLCLLVLLSVLVIVAGVAMIQFSNSSVDAESSQQAETLASMALIAEIAQQELDQQAQISAQAPAAIGPADVIPQSSIDHVAALDGRSPEVGSNDWCEVMMVKPSKDWTLDEQAVFAKHCL